jgi:exodeoxyribonuclease VII large subunit
MELAGEGALLKMLEDRRKKLAAEGLFDEARKKPIPFLPQIIGVVTSPTGAVIRDILHRISERYPRRVIIWPVAVQGTGAGEQISAAIHGFNALPAGTRPDLIIVARGGGSLEDLMAFNEEAVVRAAADSKIPLISAVGHETDTTLIDYAADLRSPTPTAAAERAVPVRLDLLAFVRDCEKRMAGATSRSLREHKTRLSAVAAKLGDPARLMDIKTQNLDILSSKLLHGFERGIGFKSARLAPLIPRHPASLIAEKARHAGMVAEALTRAGNGVLKDPEKHLAHASRMLESLSFQRVLDRGFAVVRGPDGQVISDAEAAQNQPFLDIEFRGAQHIKVLKG